MRRILLSAGEASGDRLGAGLARAIRAAAPDVELVGMGGDEMAEAGVRLLQHASEVAVVGIVEVAKHLPAIRRAMNRLTRALTEEKPDLFVPIDFPDFNFFPARALHKRGVPVVYYISPQVWAWRKGRLKTIRDFADRVLVIFPFEEPIYREAGVPVEFVGHPLIDLAAPTLSRDDLCRAHGLDPVKPVVAVLPGSRANEVSRIFPDLATAAHLIRAQLPNAQFIVARAPHLDDALFAAARGLEACAIVAGHTDAVLGAADVALTASGTATIQTALHDTPMVIVYRVSPLTYQLGRRLVRVDAIGMVNLIAGEKIVPELVQDAFTPEAVAREALSMLTDPNRATTIREGLARVRAKLGGSGASRRAAQAILRVAKEKQ